MQLDEALVIIDEPKKAVEVNENSKEYINFYSKSCIQQNTLQDTLLMSCYYELIVKNKYAFIIFII